MPWCVPWPPCHGAIARAKTRDLCHDACNDLWHGARDCAKTRDPCHDVCQGMCYDKWHDPHHETCYLCPIWLSTLMPWQGSKLWFNPNHGMLYMS